jgi:hypothetical protein
MGREWKFVVPRGGIGLAKRCRLKKVAERKRELWKENNGKERCEERAIRPNGPTVRARKGGESLARWAGHGFRLVFVPQGGALGWANCGPFGANESQEIDALGACWRRGVPPRHFRADTARL